MTVEQFWKKYLKEKNKNQSLCYTSELSFGEDDESSAYFILQILSGKKTAFSSSYKSFEIDNARFPQKGDVYIVTDYLDNPYAIIETTEVTTLPFNCVPWSLAQKEDEADSFAEWKEVKAEFFEDDGDIMGYNFTQTMPVVFEEFKVIYRNT